MTSEASAGASGCAICCWRRKPPSSVVLLIGAALLVRSFVALVNVNPGYDPTNVLTGRVYLSGPAATPERRQQIVEALVDRVRSSPGVVSAGAGSMAPLNSSTSISGFSFRPSGAGEPVVARALHYVVTPGYAEALGLRKIEGRLLRAQRLDLARFRRWSSTRRS